jgi:phospholipid-transporting ATPase
MESNRQSYKKNQIAPLRLSTRGRSRYNFYINDNKKNEMYDYRSNIVDQSKYNILTFLPKSLLFQFLRLANIYFLVVAVVQMIPIVSPLNPMTAVAPLVFVLFVSMFREGIEDFERHKYDNQLNSEPVIAYKNNEWINTLSGDLQMGDLVVVTQDNSFPADMILLDSSLNDGVCYIETASLDGEKTLKNKSSPKGISKKFHSDNGSNQWKQNITLSGNCNCDGPNPDLYKFDGNLELSFGNEELKVPLDPKSLLLKGNFNYLN